MYKNMRALFDDLVQWRHVTWHIHYPCQNKLPKPENDMLHAKLEQVLQFKWKPEFEGYLRD